MVEPDVPYDSPLRTHKKRGLPDSFASTYAHGHISGHPRTAAQQKAFEQAKAKFLRTMSAEEIEAAYWEMAKKVNTILEEDQKKKEEIEREMDKLKAQRELERRIFWKQKEEKALKEKSKRDAGGAAAAVLVAPTGTITVPAAAAAAVPTTVVAAPIPAPAPPSGPGAAMPAEVKQEAET